MDSCWYTTSHVDTTGQFDQRQTIQKCLGCKLWFFLTRWVKVLLFLAHLASFLLPPPLPSPPLAFTSILLLFISPPGGLRPKRGTVSWLFLLSFTSPPGDFAPQTRTVLNPVPASFSFTSPLRQMVLSPKRGTVLYPRMVPLFITFRFSGWVYSEA